MQIIDFVSNGCLVGRLIEDKGQSEITPIACLSLENGWLLINRLSNNVGGVK